MMRLSAWLAVAVGAVLGLAQGVRNFDNWANWPTWMLDEAAAAMLIVAGVMSLRRRGSRLLIAGWGVAVGLYGSALVAHAMGMMVSQSAGLHAMHQRLALIITALFAVTVAGLAMTLLEKKTAA